MSKLNFDEIRVGLEERRQELLSKQKNKKVALKEEVPDADEVDKFAALIEKDIIFILSENESEELRAIDAALQRMDAGTYGICKDCGNPIPKNRLKALPIAVLCISCKERKGLAIASGTARRAPLFPPDPEF